MADEQWIFIDHGNTALEPFNQENPISSGLNQLLLLYPGSFAKDYDSKLEFSQLAVTGANNSGTVSSRFLSRMEMERPNRQVFNRERTSDSYIVAAQVTGKSPQDDLVLDKNQLSDENDPADQVDDKEAAEKAAQKAERAPDERRGRRRHRLDDSGLLHDSRTGPRRLP